MNLSSLSRELVMALPPDEMALRLLRAITDGEGRQGFFFGKDRVIPPDVSDRGYHQRLEEAFAWMVREVWIANEPTQSSPNWFFVTRRGWAVLDDPAGLARAQAEARLQIDLHPRLAQRVRAQFLLGEYEAAALLAMREVEITVRDRAGAANADIGVALMKKAFAEDGPLTDPKLERGEQQARMALYWGAIGMFKNPSSHRQVDFDDPRLASEVILLADLLLRLLMSEAPWYSELREAWRPADVRLLLIGESAPDPGAAERRFFYAPTLDRRDNLFRSVVQAMYDTSPGRAGDPKAAWLERLRADRVFLIDLVPFPVDKLLPGERARARRANAEACVGTARNLAPAGVIVCHGPSFEALKSPAAAAGLPLLHDAPIPFPLGNWRAEFVKRFSAALSRLG